MIMKKNLFAGLALSLLSLSLAAQELSFPEIEGFKTITKYPVYLPENLWDFIDGAADTYLALGFVDLHVAEYKKGKDVIKAEIYRHRDHIMAFGIYASERSASYNYINIGSQGYVADGAINFFKGNFYVKLRTYSKKPKALQAEQSLARRIEGMLPGESAMPEILALFPSEGKKANEETYVNESVLGHQFLNRAFKALYSSGTDNFSIFLMRSSADETIKAAKTYLETCKTGFEESETRYMFTDGYNGTIFMSWKDNLMVIISGLAKDQAGIAERYISDILR